MSAYTCTCATRNKNRKYEQKIKQEIKTGIITGNGNNIKIRHNISLKIKYLYGLYHKIRTIIFTLYVRM